jgi:DNA primase
MVNDIEAAKRAIKRALANPVEAARVLGLDPTFSDRKKREKPRPGTALVRCVFHADSNPSMSLMQAPDGTLRAHCFTCDRAWDVIAVYAAKEGREGATGRAWIEGVLEPLARLAGVALDVDNDAPAERSAYSRAAQQAEDKRRQEAERWRAPSPLDASDLAFAAVAEVLLYAGRLDGGPLSRDVCAYLDGRGLLDVARAEGWAALPPAGPAARSWARMLRDIAPDLARSVATATGLAYLRCLRLVARELRRLIERDRTARTVPRPPGFL